MRTFLADAWTAIALIGALVATRLWWAARLDYRALKSAKQNGPRGIIARMNRRFGLVVALNEAHWFALGLLAVLSLQLPRLIVLLFFFGFRVLFVTALLLNLRDRKRLERG